jgi:hypothetical protein
MDRVGKQLLKTYGRRIYSTSNINGALNLKNHPFTS